MNDFIFLANKSIVELLSEVSARATSAFQWQREPRWCSSTGPSVLWSINAFGLQDDFFFLVTLAHVIDSQLKGDREAWGQRHLNSILSSWETIHHRPPLLPTSVGLWCSQAAEQQPLLQRFYISAVSTVVTKTYFRMISSSFSSLFYRLSYFRMGFCWCAGSLTLNTIIFGTTHCKIVCYQCEHIQHSKRV